MRGALVTLAALAAAGAAGAQGLPLEQRVDAIVVRDAAGTAYPYPFAGGFGSAAGYLSPKPQLVDLVGDARPDLVVTEGGGALAVYENVAGGPGFGFRWRTDVLRDIAPGAWYRFGDMDGDGDADLLAWGGPTVMRYWRNDGRAADGLPILTLLADPLLAADGVSEVNTEDNSVPALFDADGDGDLDFLYGQVDRGDVALWRNVGNDSDGRPLFEFVTNRFEDLEIYEASPTCGPPSRPGFPGLERQGGMPGFGRPSMKHGANGLVFADIDADGDREFFWGDYFARSLWYFRNDGTPQDANFQFVSEAFPLDEPLTSGGYNVATFADVDLDGDQDLVFGILGGLCATAENWFDALFFYENVGTPAAASYTLRTPRMISGVDVGRRSVPALVDLDADGDLDLVLANEADPAAVSSANLALFRNTGSATAPEFRLEDADWLSLDYDFGAYGPTFGDLDGDGDPDLLVGGFNGRIAYLRNDGTPAEPAFVMDTTRYWSLDMGQYARLALGDVDGDGDLDLIGGDANGRVRLYRNTGTASAAVFPSANGLPLPEDDAYRDAAGLPADIGEFSTPALYDVDGDGDLDVLIGTDAGPTRFFRNAGSPTAPAWVEEAPLPPVRRGTTPAAGDLDGDGDVDVLLGTSAGGLSLFLNTTVPNRTEPRPRGSRARIDAMPNPSRGGVTFRVSAGSAAAGLSVVVSDLSGRRVRRLEVARGAAGVEWDAATGAGPAPAGVYVARLESAGQILDSETFTLVR